MDTEVKRSTTCMTNIYLGVRSIIECIKEPQLELAVEKLHHHFFKEKFLLSLYAFPPKGTLGYEAAPFPHL